MVIWIIGMPGAGKTAVGALLYKQISSDYKNTVFIDGDDIRNIMLNDLGHTIEDRKINATRIRNFCKHLDKQNINIVCSIMSIFQEDRDWNRENYESYYEVFLNTPLEILITRDQKGLYSKAYDNQIKDVVGVDIPFNSPINPDLIINNDPKIINLQQITETIYDAIQKQLSK
jgi:adenylylsulfate kinase-like enzyme